MPIAAAATWPAGLQRCDVCGAANEPSRAFCLNCGAKLNKARATTRAGFASVAGDDKGGHRMRLAGYAVGAALLLALAAVVAFVALGGFGFGPTPSATSPLASLIAANSSGSPLTASSLSPGTDVPASNQAVVTPPATLEAGTTTAPDTPALTTPPDTAPPPTGSFVCAASTLSASAPGNWKIIGALASRNSGADTLRLELQSGASGSPASVAADILSPDQVQPTYGVPGPSSGDVAVVLAFNDAVTLVAPFGSGVGYRTLQEFQIYRTGGHVLAVVGVKGSGCYSLTSEAWTSGSASTPTLTIAIEH